MAVLDLQEQEQVDAFKHFWKSYGQAIGIGLLAVALGYGGVVGWKSWKSSQAEKAAIAYKPLAEALDQPKPDLKKLHQLADQLAKEHPSTIYAVTAALATAKQDVAEGDLKDAQQRLQWVLEHAKDEYLLAVTRLRLSAVQLDAGKNDEALKTLQAEHPAEFDSLYAEARGDALSAKGDKAGAETAYKSAQGSADEMRKPLLDWKLQKLKAGA